MVPIGETRLDRAFVKVAMLLAGSRNIPAADIGDPFACLHSRKREALAIIAHRVARKPAVLLASLFK